MEKALNRMYKVRKKADGVYAISSSIVMCWLIVGDKEAMLIDTAYGFEDLSEVVRDITSLPLTVLNSHGHIDHTGGNFYFNTPVCIHEADVEVYRRHNQPEFHRHMEKSLKWINRIIFWRTLIPKDPERNDRQRANFDNWRFIKEGDCFDLGGITAQIIEIPGHTSGSVAVFLPEKRLMITSDGANPGTYLFLPESTGLSTYIESLKKLKSYDYDFILTGHDHQLMPKSDLVAWLHVAEHPGLNHSKRRKDDEILAPGVHAINCWAEDDAKHKGPMIVLDPAKVDLEVEP